MNSRAVLPLGENCHLGMALTRFGHHEASLFRWADVPLARLLAFLESRDGLKAGGCNARPAVPAPLSGGERRPAEWDEALAGVLAAHPEGERPPHGDSLFSGPTAFRFAGTTLGTLDHAEMRERLSQAPADARINTIVFDADGDSYVHGVQLSLAEAARLSPDAIRFANATKIAHLTRKFLIEIQTGAPVAVRLEWAPVVDAEPFLRLGGALRRLNSAVTLYIVAPAGGFEGERDAARFVGLRTPLPSRSDVVNVTRTLPELSALFVSWSVAPAGAEKPYIFDI